MLLRQNHERNSMNISAFRTIGIGLGIAVVLTGVSALIAEPLPATAQQIASSGPAATQEMESSLARG